MNELPKPKFQIGDTVYAATTEGGSEEAPCPDCLGAGTWSVKSPAGYEGTTACPRCRGRKQITKQFAYKPYVRTLTIGSVRFDSAAQNDESVSYMCKETGIGSGTIWYESRLHHDKAAATDAATENAALQTAAHRERTVDLNRDLSLYDLKHNDAEIKAACEEARKAQSAYNRLLDRILELDAYPVAGGEFSDEPSPSLQPDQIRGVQNSLVWLDKRATEALIDYRNADR